ncbi:CLCN2 [Cordylochernes scorpioides]|uniref:CLCN2 n=1 Tax=Cordylochernes scorpioides TaxID=51811 RepID=A0ABY6LH36_9ARAC|nr:CLCN2 [Cordylochernes scorpioides]
MDFSIDGPPNGYLSVFWEHTFARLGEDWVFLALLGIISSLLSFLMDYAKIWLYRDLTQHILLQYLAWVSFPLILILFSAGFVHVVAPQAIGSGIPEMKTILRGVVLKEYLTFRTLVSKMIGLTCSLGSGMPLGKEGPFVHVASMVAALLSKIITSFKGIYENESRSTEMLAAACAVGVACSFAAPIGETLTALFKTNFPVDFPFDPYELIAFVLIGRFLYPSIVTLLISSITFPQGLGQFMAAELTTHQSMNELFSNATWSRPNLEVDDRIIVSHWSSPYTSIYINLVIFLVMNCSRCGRQGHRRANCPMIPARTSNIGRPHLAPHPGALPTAHQQLTRPTPKTTASPPKLASKRPALQSSAPGTSTALPARAPSDAMAPPSEPMELAAEVLAPPTSNNALQAMEPMEVPEASAVPRPPASQPAGAVPQVQPASVAPPGPLPAQGTIPAAVTPTPPLPAPRPAEPTPPAPHGEETTPVVTTPPPPLPLQLTQEQDLEFECKAQISAAFGRLVGECMAAWFPDGIQIGGKLINILPGGYAVVGAAALSGAATHTVSTSVIVFELTGQMSHILPVIRQGRPPASVQIAVLVANAIAQKLQPSIYDSIIQIKKLPYLPPIISTSSQAHNIFVDDIMVRDVVYIWQGITYKEMRNVLKTNKRLNFFPLVESPESMILLGTMQRSELIHQLDRHLGREARLQEVARRKSRDAGRVLLSSDTSLSTDIRRPSRFEIVPVNNRVTSPPPTPPMTPKSILKHSPMTSPYSTINSTQGDSRLRQAFETIFRKALTLQDVNPVDKASKTPLVRSASLPKRVTLVSSWILATVAFRMLTVAYGEATLDRSNVYRWYKMFSEGREDVNDEERAAGHPSTSTTDEKINEVEKMILANRRITVREVAEDLNISIGSCHSIFINDLGMRRVAAKFVPKLLNCNQKQHRMNIANEMLDSVRDDPNLLQRVITGDEAWVYGYDVETKAQSSQWKLPHEPRPKKARQVRSNVKVLLTVFFDCRGVVHHEFLPQGRTVNKEHYLQVMRNLRKAIRQKRPDLWKNKNWLLHHDNAPAHTSLLVRNFLAKNNTLMMPQPPYSPDLAPCDFF